MTPLGKATLYSHVPLCDHRNMHRKDYPEQLNPSVVNSASKTSVAQLSQRVRLLETEFYSSSNRGSPHAPQSLLPTTRARSNAASKTIRIAGRNGSTELNDPTSAAAPLSPPSPSSGFT